MSKLTAQQVIKKLNLQQLPQDGGYYCRSFSDSLRIKTPDGLGRMASACIYYMITPEQFSTLHMLASSEVFHFYLGDPVEFVQIDAKGKLVTTTFGSDIMEDQVPQIFVSPNTWHGMKLVDGGKWALMGCMTIPGFEFKDYTHGDRANLLDHYPQHKKVIQRFTR